MTSGTRNFGSTVAVGTSFGLNYVQNGKGYKTWSGADSPKQPKQYERYTVPKDYVKWLKAPGGKRVRVVVKRVKMRKFRVYPKRLKSQQPHNYSVHFEKLTDTLMDFKIGTTPYTATAINSGFGDVSFTFPTFSANDDLESLGKLRKKVAGSTFQLGSFLGEGRQSLNMIRNAATRLAFGLRSWQAMQMAKSASEARFHARNTARYLTEGTDRQKLNRKTPANNWLELQYGWFPLLQDAHDGAQMLAHFLEVPFQSVVKYSTIKKGTINGANAPPPVGWCEARRFDTALIKERDIGKLTGLTDVASVAWELLPYSFIVDWFIPIGDYLQARGTLSGVDITLVRWQSNHGFISGVKSPSWQGRVLTRSGTFEKVYVDGGRTIIGFPEAPLPTLKGFGESLTWKRTANAVAILSQSLTLKSK